MISKDPMISKDRAGSRQLGVKFSFSTHTPPTTTRADESDRTRPDSLAPSLNPRAAGDAALEEEDVALVSSPSPSRRRSWQKMETHVFGFETLKPLKP